MTKSSKQKLEFQQGYNAKPENVKKREMNNKARAQLIKAGKVSVGDKRDVAHIKALQDGGTDAPGNLTVTSEKDNRGWRKGRSDYNVGVQK